jgi:hypothetical protein
MADIHEIMGTIAAHLNSSVPGVKSAFYPFPNKLERADCPAVVVEPVESLIDHGTNDQKWESTIKLTIMEPRNGETPKEFARVNELATPVVDAFLTDPDGRGVRRVVPGLRGVVNKISASRVVYSVQVSYGTQYAAAEVYLDVKFHRTPGGQ